MDRAEAQKALQACVADEQAYQFTSFSHRDAWELGHALVDACEKMGAPLAVEIEINHVIVFRYYPDGTGAYHEQWLRRKRNLVNLLEKAPSARITSWRSIARIRNATGGCRAVTTPRAAARSPSASAAEASSASPLFPASRTPATRPPF